jgi:GntR family transcriptional regulator
MILRIDTSAALPVYEQIREQVCRMVVAGTLAPGARLPTIRQLANDLQVAKGTVAKAYTLLEEAEVIDTQGRRGTFILPPPAHAGAIDSTIAQQLAEAADAYAVAARQLGIGLDEATATLSRRWARL